MDDFQAILLEGIFSVDDIDWKGRPDSIDVAAIYCSSDKGKQLVTDILDPLLGKQVQVAAHYYPPNGPEGIDLGKWGGGCCLWEPYGWCFAGHHEDPQFLLNVSHMGTLAKNAEGYYLIAFDGSWQHLPFSLLVGHHARIAAATAIDVEKMRQSLSESDFDIDDVQEVGAKVENLKEMLGQLSKTLKDL